MRPFLNRELFNLNRTMARLKIGVTEHLATISLDRLSIQSILTEPLLLIGATNLAFLLRSF